MRATGNTFSASPLIEPKTLRRTRVALSCFFIEMLGARDWRVFAHIKTKDSRKLPVVLSREEVHRVLADVKEPRFFALFRASQEVVLRSVLPRERRRIEHLRRRPPAPRRPHRHDRRAANLDA